MENIFPLQENVEIEEIYGSKRPNAIPPEYARSFRMHGGVNVIDNDGTYILKEPKWYRKGEVSSLEEISMDEVVSMIGKEAYVRTRDAIVCEYQNGYRPMTLGKALEMNDIGFCEIAKIFAFAERWGLINYRSLIEKEIASVEAMRNRTRESSDDKHIPTDTQEKNKEVINMPVDYKACLKQSRCDCGEEVMFFTKSMIFKCKKCFDERSYADDVLRSDFFAVNEPLVESMWSKEEELRLLEGINKYGDEWNLVSQHVQTKSKEECVFYFLRIPILENALPKSGFSEIGPVFVTAENPIMCVISFVCGVVHPCVASACSKAAMMHIGKCSQERAMRHMLDAGVSKAIEQRDMERIKIKRLMDVIYEAFLRKIRMKMNAYKEMNVSTQRVRNELVGLRQGLIDELEFVDEK
ncbi:subunit RSC8 of RSC chromatin remodeling complex [Ordospora colligata]|uniref:Subunit RSC8 of RSC chromatin remodeling complex n=1 Tax=Ordospora colligata OC4 TaxID=1354746 RepID=A0A0B2UNB5_9MICR|nr:subunit RSC8 of RSC chromatin remodeling complex [Ordospora colligata OC4]KHN70567.1 subunit RSC8 of RSC chromatin remodeling complex [Ordospora colligata OC4]TBU17317.1 subunit RSC8 of RSC chromatin remodeling complex [Ordospora colligata]TBU17567.1 ubunit RSC8 of RSC chromatin remodeling complex [Ordospora colligata]TBU19747.1 subunit RSC8 of RSC chromatin remodeling complex [Ordospora colligata]